MSEGLGDVASQDVTHVPDESLVRGRAGKILLVTVFGTFGQAMGRQALPPLLPEIIDTLAITSSQAGLALTVVAGLGALSRYPGGRFSDELSRKTILVGGLLVFIVGISLLASAPTYVLFLFGAAIVGISSGMYPPTAVAQLSDTFVARRGQALGINNAFVYVGGTTAAGLVTVVLLVTTWRYVFIPIIVFLVLITALMNRWHHDEYVVDVPQVDLGVRRTVVRLLNLSRVRWIFVAAILFSFAWNGIFGFLPLFLQTASGMTQGWANNMFALLFATGIAANIVAGILGDYLGYLQVVIFATLFTLVGLLGLLWTQQFGGIVLSVIILGIGLSGFWPVFNAYVMKLFPSENRGGDLGAVSMVYMGGGSLGPVYVGFVAAQLDYTVAFTGLVPCVILSGFIALWLSRKGP